MRQLVELLPADAGLGPHRHSGPVVGYVRQGRIPFELEGEAPTEAGEPAVLLAAKSAPPGIRAQLIERAALIEILSAEPSRKLTLLSAPAGWGKTTLLAQWVSGADDRRRRGWLSLDASDNDPARYWACAIAALGKASPGVAPRAFELIKMGADPRQVVLPTLLNELAAIDYQIALILDDYHLVENRTVHEQVDFVVERMPQTFRLVIATRSDPVLPLARLRAHGELLELRAEELRFQAGEAADLLDGVLGLKLTDAQVQLLFPARRGGPPVCISPGCRWPVAPMRQRLSRPSPATTVTSSTT